MKLIVCIDNNNGMAFNGRRQSSDRTVLLKIREMVQSGKLWIHPYSEKLVSTIDVDYAVDAGFLELASVNDYCFAETMDVMPCFSNLNEIVVFRWNRKYPADLYFPAPLLSEGWIMDSSSSFSGYSHAEITQEIYLKCRKD